MYREKMKKEKTTLEKNIDKILTSNNPKIINKSYNEAKQHLENIHKLALRKEKENQSLITCCFTGHRPEKLSISEKEAKELLRKKIDDEILHHGKKVFITGMARGVDIWASEIILEEKIRFPEAGIKLIAALPYPNFDERWEVDWKIRYDNILKKADKVKIICSKYCDNCYQQRNEWMVNHSSLVIAIWNGKPSGTKNTIDYAIKRNVKVENCLDEN